MRLCGALHKRKSFDGLSGVVIDIVDQDPQSGHLFLFFNRRRSMMKALVWEASGYWVLSKRLQGGRFQIFDRANGARNSFELSSSELTLLVDGIDLRGAKRQHIAKDIEALLHS